jgi:hypothetical protein
MARLDQWIRWINEKSRVIPGENRRMEDRTWRWNGWLKWIDEETERINIVMGSIAERIEDRQEMSNWTESDHHWVRRGEEGWWTPADQGVFTTCQLNFDNQMCVQKWNQAIGMKCRNQTKWCVRSGELNADHF